MTVKNVSNLAASVQARLQNHARATKRPFQELLQYYAMERFLYRLSTTPLRARFVLKGALMLHVWDAPLARATKDRPAVARGCDGRPPPGTPVAHQAKGHAARPHQAEGLMRVLKETEAIVRWYFDEGRVEGVPFYCDPTLIGAFAIEPDELGAGTDAAVFRLFVTLSMYQALRDVVIMRQQRSLPRASVRVVAAVATVKRSIARHACPTLGSVEAFEEGCDVVKDGDDIDCGTCPGAACHIKDATRVFNRMGDMGKLPTSAWLRLWQGGGMQALLKEVCREELSPTRRATLLVERFATVHRVGRKLATMFVSALSTPALAPGLTPWFPKIDGNELVVVDTNVARAVDALRAPGAARTYDARELWVREQAACIDLRGFQPDLPAYSPRLLQEALYAFCSKSNRVARGDACAVRGAPCATCAPRLCPFAPSAESRGLRGDKATAPGIALRGRC